MTVTSTTKSIRAFPPPPLVGGDAGVVAKWVDESLLTVVKRLNAFGPLALNVSYKEPGRPRAGLLAYVDGSQWNPTSDGEGTYQYKVAGVWEKLAGLDTAQTWTAVQTFTGQPTNFTSASLNAIVQITCTDATGGIADSLNLFRDSVSPAANDRLVSVRWDARDSIATRAQVANLQVILTDPTDGSEDAVFEFQNIVAGTLAARFKLGAGLYYAAGTDPGANKINVTGINLSGTDLFGTFNTFTVQQHFTATNSPIVITNTTDSSFVGGLQIIGDRATPTAGDRIVQQFFLNNTLGVSFEAVRLSGRAQTIGSGTEDGQFWISTMQAGAVVDAWKYGLGFFYATGSDPGANKINVTGINLSGTSLFATANTWTAKQTISGTGTGNLLVLTSTDAGAAAASILQIYRDSVSPAAADEIGYVQFQGRDGAANTQEYSGIICGINDPTSTSEDSYIRLFNNVAGAATTIMRWDIGVQIGAPTSGDMGAGTLNLDNALYRDGTQVVGARVTGWAAATNTKSKATFDTTTVTLPNLAARVGQIIDDMIAHGLIGA